jgi:integrase
MAKRGSRRRGGWRRKRGKLQAYVRIHEGPGGLRTRTYSLDTAAADIQKWIDETFRKQGRRRVAAGTLAADVKAYLPALVDRPRLQQQRATQLAWWCDRFGSRTRASLKPLEIETALNELTAAGKAPSTVQKYRTALYHLFTKLDGKSEPNPLRDVPVPRPREPQLRAIPYDIIEAIFAAMPDRRYATKLEEAEAAAIYKEATQPKANRSAIARAHGLSETMVRKIVAKAGKRFDAAAQGKAILRVIAYTGLPPAQIKLLEPSHIDWQTPSSVMAQGRKKGGGTRSVRLPLVPQGVDALRAFVDAGAVGVAFSSSSLNATFRRGVSRMCAKLEAKPETRAIGEQLRVELREATPYWLRHSFLTESQLATGNINATQSLAMHSDARMTRRYLLAAVAPELRRAAELLTARWGGQRTGNESTETASRGVEIRPKNAKGKKGTNGRSGGGKTPKSSMK